MLGNLLWLVKLNTLRVVGEAKTSLELKGNQEAIEN